MKTPTIRSRRLPLVLALCSAGLAATTAAHAWDDHDENATRYASGGGRVATQAFVGRPANGLVRVPPVTDSTQVSALGFWLTQLATAPAKLGYCPTESSAFAKSVFYAGGAQKPCVSTGYWTDVGRAGFSARTPFADFVTTDVPLAKSEVDAYVWNAKRSGSPVSGRGIPVQIPAVLSSIGIVYNNPDLGSTPLEIGSQTVCQIFAGEITNWNQIDETLPSRPIRPVVRAETNAASFAFTNYLNSVCGGDGETFGVSGTFWRALPQPLPAGASTRHFTALATNAAVSKYVRGVKGSIAFVEAANAKPLLAGSPARFALLDGLDPFANLPEAASYVSNFPLLVDTAIGPDVPNGRPALVPLTPRDKTGCSLLVDPSATGFAAGGYPIVSVSYLLLSSSGNGAKTDSLQKLGGFLSDAASFPAEGVTTPRITTIDLPSDQPGTGKTGHAAIAAGTEAALAIAAAVPNCIGQ